MARIGIDSKFAIDLNWMESQGRDVREKIWDELCEGCRQHYSLEERRQVDRVNPETGEVTRWDALWECVVDECGRTGDFVSPKMPLTRAIYRSFLASGNAPLSASELHKRIGKGTPQAILRELLSPAMELEGIAPV